MFHAAFLADEFPRRRTRVLDAVGKQTVVLVQGGPKEPAHDRFRQTNDFYYLCGVEVPHAYLLLDGRADASYLFLAHLSSTVITTLPLFRPVSTYRCASAIFSSG